MLLTAKKITKHGFVLTKRPWNCQTQSKQVSHMLKVLPFQDITYNLHFDTFCRRATNLKVHLTQPEWLNYHI
jgi:hypothetical protein